MGPSISYMRCLVVITKLAAAYSYFHSLKVSPNRKPYRAERLKFYPYRHSIRHLHASASPPCSGYSNDRLVVGLNKYSHDAAVCVLRERDGALLFAGEKERLTRKKHDGGETGELVQHALDSIGANLEDVKIVVSNNHHHRVAPFERRIPWAVAQNIYPASFAAPQNLIPCARHAELSHHLAHAWSATVLAPFDRGLIVVMDGMGESYGAMARAEAAMARNDVGDHPDFYAADYQQYHNDLRLIRELGGTHAPPLGQTFQRVPKTMEPHEAYREAESAYTFVRGSDGTSPVMTPIYKRWTRERSPPELYNHGFENMESMGAVYSRVSSHIFGDWNACGKVMGLAPWAAQWSLSDVPPPRLTSGALLANEDGGFRVHWDAIDGLSRPNELYDLELRPYYAALASTAQKGLEEVAMSFIAALKERTGEENVCLCGGVALNSVLNGRVAREVGFKRFFVPPYPGDEGIAVGCAAFGWHQVKSLDPFPEIPRNTRQEVGEEVKSGVQGVVGEDEEDEEKEMRRGATGAMALFGESCAPFWGRQWSTENVEDELKEWESWVQSRPLENVEEVAEMIAGGKVVAWFQGRGEFGPRALGSRSLLADPRDPDMPNRINTYVKKREDFRPFAPSVLAEEADDWFEGIPSDGSPFMSITAPTRPEALARIPAVCHVDGSSRLQTVRKEDNGLYHRLISAFFKKTGVPMVLNTSFNVMGEPIVDSPEDAIRALMSSAGAIDALVLHDRVITLRPFPLEIPPQSTATATATGTGEQEKHLDAHDVVPYQARPFLSEVVDRDGEEVLRVRVMPQDGRCQWIELHDEYELEVLGLADGGKSVSDMVACISEEQDDLKDEIPQEGDLRSEEEAEDAEKLSSVVGILRTLYSKGLVAFDIKVQL